MIKLTHITTKVDDPFLAVAQEYIKTKLSQHPPSQMRAREALMYYQTKRGIDDMVTRLRRLNYSLFTAVRNGRDIYLKAVTKEIETTYRSNKVSIGSYSIYVPLEGLLTGDLNSFHFIPDRHPIAGEGQVTHQRHLHHYAFVRMETRQNPLTYTNRTCWGDFGAMLANILGDGDIPELYRTLYLFLFVQNASSPLVDFRELRDRMIYKYI